MCCLGLNPRQRYYDIACSLLSLIRCTSGAIGGISGFILPTLWELITDTAEEMPIQSAMTLLVDQLEESPRFRRGQVAGALSDLQRVLEEISHHSTGHEQVSIPVGTVVILAHCLLRHQP